MTGIPPFFRCRFSEKESWAVVVMGAREKLSLAPFSIRIRKWLRIPTGQSLQTLPAHKAILLGGTRTQPAHQPRHGGCCRTHVCSAKQRAMPSSPARPRVEPAGYPIWIFFQVLKQSWLNKKNQSANLTGF
jgi:hypothetical protein